MPSTTSARRRGVANARARAGQFLFALTFSSLTRRILSLNLAGLITDRPPVSIAAATGRPVYFVGTGERPDALEPFHPDRMASRILGMGDVLGLIDRAQDSIDREKAAEQAERLATARFTLEDFLDQLRQMRRLGPLQDVLAMLPGAAASGVQVDEGRLTKAEAVICSMTPEERRNPAIIGGSRRARIAKGSGTTTADVNSLLREFDQARRMMKTVLGGGGPMGRMPKGLGRNLPGRPG